MGSKKEGSTGIDMKRNLRVVIPAAGRSSRSGLSYPKSLHRIEGLPILVRLCKAMLEYDATPIIIINPGHLSLFEETLNEFEIKAQFVFQHEPLGMGNALLQVNTVVKDDEDILLVWSDIPLLNANTIRHLVNCHRAAQNDFSLVTSLCASCYTIVKRDKGKLTAVIETRAEGLPPGKDGERDIGLFVFRKQPVFSLLQKFEEYTEVNGKKEQGFLYIIQKLVQEGYRAEGYPIAVPADVLSFNTPEDLKEIEESIGKS